MKSHAYYNALLSLNDNIFSKNPVKVGQRLLQLLRKYANDKGLYDNVFGSYKEYVQLHEDIRNHLKVVTDDYYISVYESLRIYDYFGGIYLDKLMNTMTQYGIEQTNFNLKVQEVIKQNLDNIRELQNFVTLSIASLSKLRSLQYSKLKSFHSDKYVLEMRIPYSLGTVNELSEIVEDWNKIVTFTKRITLPDSPDENELYSLADGSVVFAFVAALPTIYLILQCIEKLYDIRIKKQQLLREIKNNNVFRDLPDETIESIKRHKLPEFNPDDLATELLTEYNIENNGENYSEAKHMLKDVISKLYTYIEKGAAGNLLRESVQELKASDTIEENNSNTKQILRTVSALSSKHLEYEKFLIAESNDMTKSIEELK